MASAPTYIPIATQTLNSTVSTVTFSSIPQTYTDLVIIMNLIGTTGGNSAAVQYNGDTNNSNYSFISMFGDGTNKGSSAFANTATQMTLLDNTTYSPNIAHVMNYSNSTTYKTYIARPNMPDNQLRIVAGTWRNTAAITSMTFFPAPNPYSFAAGSTFTIYGIAAA